MRISRAVGVLLGLGVWLAAAAPALALGWLRDLQAMRCETQAEFAAARRLESLDCAGMEAYVAEQNWLTNQRFHAEYHRPVPRSGAVSVSVSDPMVPTVSPTPGPRPNP